MKKILIPIAFTFLVACSDSVSDESYGYLNSEAKNASATFKNSDVENTSLVDEYDCPPEGNAKPARVRVLNRYKNRTEIPKEEDYNSNITLSEILRPGNDETRWRNDDAARIVGYVYDVKPGGIETTNCKSKDKSYRDTHIEIVANPMSATKKDVMVIEVTPRIRSLMKSKGEDWSTSMLRSKYLGRWVEIEGWMLFDLEHDNMAENTRPENPKNWRATAWEIHPVTSFKLTNKR